MSHKFGTLTNLIAYGHFWKLIFVQVKAVYFYSGDLSPPEYQHYGLAAPLYTHFTSPIRRYAGSGLPRFVCLVTLVYYFGSLTIFVLQMSLFTDCSLHRWESSNFRHYSLTDQNSRRSLIVWKYSLHLSYLLWHGLKEIWHMFADSCKLFSDLNYRHRNAQMAGRASVELHTLIYFKKRYAFFSMFITLVYS